MTHGRHFGLALVCLCMDRTCSTLGQESTSLNTSTWHPLFDFRKHCYDWIIDQNILSHPFMTRKRKWSHGHVPKNGCQSKTPWHDGAERKLWIKRKEGSYGGDKGMNGKHLCHKRSCSFWLNPNALQTFVAQSEVHFRISRSKDFGPHACGVRPIWVSPTLQ